MRAPAETPYSRDMPVVHARCRLLRSNIPFDPEIGAFLGKGPGRSARLGLIAQTVAAIRTRLVEVASPEQCLEATLNAAESSSTTVTTTHDTAATLGGLTGETHRQRDRLIYRHGA